MTRLSNFEQTSPVPLFARHRSPEQEQTAYSSKFHPPVGVGVKVPRKPLASGVHDSAEGRDFPTLGLGLSPIEAVRGSHYINGREGDLTQNRFTDIKPG